MDREAIRAGKRPVEESSSSDGDNPGPVNQGPRPQSTGGVVIREPSRIAGPPIRAVPLSSRRPALPPVVSSDPAGPSGIASTVTLEDLEAIRAKFHVPDFIGLSVPGPEDRVTSNHCGRVALYEEFFRCGLRLPFHPFFLNLLDRYRLVPAQLTPNSVRIICAFVVLCHFEGVRPGLSLFRVFYKLRRQGEGAWWAFTARPKRAFPLGLPSKVRGWKSRFLFAHVEGMRGAWREPDTSSNENSTVEARDKDLFVSLSNCQIPNYKELLSEENLVEAELAPATGEPVTQVVLPSFVVSYAVVVADFLLLYVQP